MGLSDTDKNILEDIVKLDGQCMESSRCRKCPFRAICLPEFLNPIPPSQAQRLKIAQDVLTHHYLIDDTQTSEDFQWGKKF